jgi:hypothetical protein
MDIRGSISGFAENLVEKFTGSEAAGDIVGMAASYAMGDVKGVAEQGIDLSENIGRGVTKFAEGFLKAAGDAVKEFSNPGAVKQPNEKECRCEGYSTGEANGADDTGVIGEQGGAEETKGLSEDQQLDSILSDPGASLESKIFALLTKLGKAGEKKVKDQVDSLAAKEKKGEKLGQMELNELQRAQSDLAQLTQLQTSLMQSFKQMKDSVIQNIGR